VWARRGSTTGKRERPTSWRIAKRGTVFAREPDLCAIDLYKDVTHLYRHRQTGKKCGRKEWATTFWIGDTDVQTLRSTAQVRYHQCSDR